MLKFSKPSISDAQKYRELFLLRGECGCDYCFGSAFLWADAYGTRLAEENGFAFCRSGEHGKYHYLFPAGAGDENAALELLFADAIADGKEFELYSLSQSLVTANRYLADTSLFTVSRMDDYDDFVYASHDLAELKGKKYHGKRNHIHSFLEDYPDSRFEPITPARIADCHTINDAWFLEKYGGFSVPEYESVQKALANYDALALTGGILYARGKPAAFTMGEALTADIFCTHIEKAAPEFRGAYAVINREFARTLTGRFRYINREDSAGDPGVHSAKMSYHPAFMAEKYIARPTEALYSRFYTTP